MEVEKKRKDGAAEMVVAADMGLAKDCMQQRQILKSRGTKQIETVEEEGSRVLIAMPVTVTIEVGSKQFLEIKIFCVRCRSRSLSQLLMSFLDRIRICGDLLRRRLAPVYLLKRLESTCLGVEQWPLSAVLSSRS
jgi:hypothetical protein